MIVDLRSTCKCFVCCGVLLALVTASLAQRPLVSNDDLILSSKTVDGFPKLTVTSSIAKGKKTLYTAYQPGIAVNYALPWRIHAKDGDVAGFFIAYEFSTGSSNLLKIVGPDAHGVWRELLSVTAEMAYQFQPELIDLVGDGIVDVIVISDYPRRPTIKNPLDEAKVAVWRWSPRLRRYRLAAKTTYKHRLEVEKSRD